MSDSPMMTRAEAARWCRVSLAAFDTHVRPLLPHKLVGRRVLVHRADLEAWAQAEAVETKAHSLGAPSLRPRPRSEVGGLRERLRASPGYAALKTEMDAAMSRRAAREAKQRDKAEALQ